VEVARLVSRYGAQAVYGRPLGVVEARRLALTENVEQVCRRWAGPEAGKWFESHPDDMRLLTWAAKAHTHA
jgi:hypothetical protein